MPLPDFRTEATEVEQVTALKVILGIFYMLICLVLIIIILKQESKGDGLSSVITGENSESFFSKNKGLSKERFLSKLTVVLSVFFAVVAIVLSVLMRM
ncbi:MAG TPA: preprotein translocase subunit SecG [Clostridiales bacterium]|nr:preprotein translocase subunit SecG [Clostridiales bacterium]